MARKAIGTFEMTAAFMIGGCNTIAGAGKDIEAGGENVQDAAQDTKQKM